MVPCNFCHPGTNKSKVFTFSRQSTLVLGDIDPEFNVVEVTEEAKQELAKIENKVGSKVLHIAIRLQCSVYLEYEFQT